MCTKEELLQKILDGEVERQQVQFWRKRFWNIRNAKKMGLQDAINDLPSTGGCVYIPPNTTINITTPILVPSNVAIIGAGQTSMIRTTSDIDIIRCYDVGAANVTPGVYLSNFHIIGSDTGTGNGVVVKNSHYTTISNLWIEHVYYGIYLKALDADSDNTDNNIIKHCHIFDTLADGILLYGQTAGRCEDNVVQGNVLNYCGGNGISAHPGRRNSIVGNTVEDCSSHGIELHSGHKNTVTGNTSSENVKNGIYLYDEDHSIVSGNSCCYNDCDDSNTYDGIQVHNDSNYNIISNNVCTDNDRYGIYIRQSDCDENKVVNNICVNNTTAQFYDSGTKTAYGGMTTWLATTVTKTGGTDYTADGAWTDLDLSSNIPATAKIVLLQLQHKDSCTAADQLSVRKNGETPTAYPQCMAQVSSKYCNMTCEVGVDNSAVIEYYATDASDTVIYILGYRE